MFHFCKNLEANKFRQLKVEYGIAQPHNEL